MKKRITLILCSILLLGFTASTNIFQEVGMPPIMTSVDVYQSQPKGIGKAFVHLNELRKNQLTNEVSWKDVYKAKEQVQSRKHQKSNSIDIEWEELGPNNVGGRVRALIFDKDDPDLMLTGGVAGGLWKSDDAGNNWKIVQNSIDVGCIAVSSIVQASNGHIYVGTGEYFSSLGFGSGTDVSSQFPGSGVFKSTDGGTSWNLLVSTDPINSIHWADVNRLAVHPDHPNLIYAATRSQFYLSEDGGESWSVPLGIDNTNSPAWDVQVGSDGTVYLIKGSNYYRSTDGLTFSKMDSNTDSNLYPTTISSQRKVLAVSPSNPAIVYSAIAEPGTNNCLEQVIKSTDGGATWFNIGNGSTNFFDPLDGGGYCQGWYDFCIGVSLADPHLIWIGGISLWSGELIGDVYAWNKLDVPGGGANPSLPNYMHSDKHFIAFHPSNPDIAYVTTDGGVFKCSNAQQDFPSFEPKNKGLNITQFYSVAAGHSGRVLGGTQDNSSPYIGFNYNGTQAANILFGGDGGFAEISNINSNILIVESQFGNMVRSLNRGESFQGFFDKNIDCFPLDDDPNLPSCQGDGVIDGGAPFITVFHLWEDVDLYYFIKSKMLPPNQDELSVNYNNQTFTITNNIVDVPKIDAIDEYNDDELIIGWDAISNQLIEDARIIRSRFFTSGLDGKLWMTEEVLRFDVTPTWLEIGQISGQISAISTSYSGDMVYAGTTNGRLLRVTNLNSGNYSVNTINNTPFAGRYVTGVHIDQSNPNVMVVSCGNYGNSSYVYRSEDALSSNPSFVDITNNLPHFPVYDVIIDSDNPSTIIAATDHGVWACDINNFYTWCSQNSGLGEVAVFRLRQERIAREQPEFYSFCKALYIGTHGRGLFRSTSLTSSFCPENVISIPDFVLSDNDDETDWQETLDDLKIFPNPVSGSGAIQFSLLRHSPISIDIYDIQGKLVQAVEQGSYSAGQHKIQFSVENLASGNYLIAIQKDQDYLTRKISVVH